MLIKSFNFKYNFKIKQIIKKALSNNQEKEKTDKFLSEEKKMEERFHPAWIMTCKAYNIDPENPPKMDKRMFFAGTLENHQKYMDEQEKILKAK